METMDLAARKQIADVVALVARAFEREADDDLLARVEACEADPISGLPEEAQKLADRARRQLAKAIASREAAEDKALWKDYLDAAYAELFLGVSKDPIAPFESVYRSAEKTLYSKQYFAVTDLMAQVGYAKPSDFEEPEDHLAIELDLFAKLTIDACAQAEAGDSDQALETLAYAQVLKEDHLDAWVSKACDDLIERDDSNGFYSGMANLAKAAMMTL